MPDENTNTVTVTQPSLEVTGEPTEPVCYKTADYILYKMDRTLAILGIIGIAVVALFIYAGAEGVQIATGAIGGLVGYVGGRTGK
jgi:hypothetical protein